MKWIFLRSNKAKLSILFWKPEKNSYCAYYLLTFDSESDFSRNDGFQNNRNLIQINAECDELLHVCL